MLAGKRPTAEEVRRHNRNIAVTSCHFWQLFGMAAAVAFFLANVIGDWGRADPQARMLQWGVHNTTGVDRHRRGRPPLVSRYEAKACLDEFLAGYEITDQKSKKIWTVHYCSLADAILIGKAPHIMYHVVKREVHPRTLWRHMQAAAGTHKPLAKYKKPVTRKFVLDDKAKTERVKVAKKLVRVTPKQLEAVIWIDSKKIELKKELDKVWVYCPEKSPIVEDERIPKGKYTSGITMNYYAAVCSLTGPIYFTYVTGTTDIKKHRGYTYKKKVRHPTHCWVLQSTLLP